MFRAAFPQDFPRKFHVPYATKFAASPRRIFNPSRLLVRFAIGGEQRLPTATRATECFRRAFRAFINQPGYVRIDRIDGIMRMTQHVVRLTATRVRNAYYWQFNWSRLSGVRARVRARFVPVFCATRRNETRAKTQREDFLPLLRSARSFPFFFFSFLHLFYPSVSRMSNDPLCFPIVSVPNAFINIIQDG